MENELEKLESQYFMLQMKDTWDSSDYRFADELKEKIKNIKNNVDKINIL